MNQPYWKDSEDIESSLRHPTPDSAFRSSEYAISHVSSASAGNSATSNQHHPQLPPPQPSHISTSPAHHASSPGVPRTTISGSSLSPAAHGTSPSLVERSPIVSGSPDGGAVDDSLGGIKKPVSSTKRAVQNRNAQRAFRQRKEKYVKELEARVAEMSSLHKKIDDLQRENRELRDYTMALQSELLKLTHNINNEQKG